MRRESGRKLGDNKIYQIEGSVQVYDYSTNKLTVDTQGNPVKSIVYYNLLDGPVFRQFHYKGTIRINNSSEFIVEVKSPFMIGPEDRFFLNDAFDSYGKIVTTRLVNKKVYNPGRHKIHTIEYEQVISAE